MCVYSSVMSNSLWPLRLWLSRYLYPWNSSGKNAEVGCHFILQGIFLTWNQIWVFHIAGRFFTIWATRKTLWISFSLSNWLFLLPSLRLVLFVPIKSSSPVLLQKKKKKEKKIIKCHIHLNTGNKGISTPIHFSVFILNATITTKPFFSPSLSLISSFLNPP